MLAFLKPYSPPAFRPLALAALCVSALCAGSAVAESTIPGRMTWPCVENPDPAQEYVNITFDPTKFGIADDDSGWEFEMEFELMATVYAYDDDKPGQRGAVICQHDREWHRDLPIPNVRGRWLFYPITESIDLGMVPRYALVVISFRAWEQDDFDNDYGDFGRYDSAGSYARVEMFVNAWKARTMTGEAEGEFDVRFGHAKRVEGDGRGGDFAASLEFVLDAHVAQRGIGGAATGGGGQSVTPPAPPTPDQHPVCKDYATRSVEQYHEAQGLGCGFVPPVWSSDHQAHFDWCVRGNNAQTVAGHVAARDRALADCRQAQVPAPNPGGNSKEAMCQSYASAAVAIATQARSRNCPGISGPRWVQDHSVHFDWCIGFATPAALQAEAAARTAAYNACIAP